MSSVDSFTLARTVAATLVEAGMREAVVCPGSRSAPLVYALSELERRGRIRLHVRVDERSAGFLAHGLSLATGRPVGVLTTSGTAVGNLLPALMEASHAGTRLVALTADRPAELHGTGANQTTSQEGLFALHARAAASVGTDPAPGDDAEAHLKRVAAEVLALLLRADGFAAETGRVREAAPGPVHLNLAFRDPLVPDAEQLAALAELPAAADSPASSLEPGPGSCPAPWRAPGADLSGFPDVDAVGRAQRRTVVLACHDAGPAASAFATALGLPLLAEPSSNARFSENAVAAYPVLLGADGGRSATAHPLAGRIERVVLFGRPTLTRPVNALLARPDVETALYAPEPAAWFQPGLRRERTVGDLRALAEFAGQGAPGWLAAWQDASLRAQSAVEGVLVREDTRRGLTPQSTAHVVAAMTRGPLVLGSSSLIRDVDLTWRPPSAPDVQVFANRGLAGIDGTVSTAVGVALGTGRRTVALLGDLTALHDAGGLLVGPLEPRADVDLVVVNDDGGAIFAGLEHGAVARAEGMGGVVERFFGTPHGTDLAALAAAHGVPHVRVADRVELIHHLGDPVPGLRVIEVRADRAARPAVAAALAEAVRSGFPAVPPAPPADPAPVADAHVALQEES